MNEELVEKRLDHVAQFAVVKQVPITCSELIRSACLGNDIHRIDTDLINNVYGTGRFGNAEDVGDMFVQSTAQGITLATRNVAYFTTLTERLSP